MESFNFVIRDALAADVEACLALDHRYESEHVWRMTISPDGEGRQINFRRERLPRPVEILYPIEEMRLLLALPRENCYLIAVGKNEPIVLGYLTMRPEPVHQIALIQDIVVAKQFRRRGVGSRLLNVARSWAQEHDAKELMVETQTINYPAIEFLQTQGLQFCGFNDQYFRNHDIAVFFGQQLR
jgi:GNAT superfamily N-acetyltransferase